MDKKRKQPCILWITDPWSKLDLKKESTIRLMEESLLFPVKTYWTDYTQIYIDNQETKINCYKISDSHFPDISKPLILTPNDFSQIHYRVDPPITHHYLYPLQALHRSIKKTKSKTQLINPPSIILMESEKWVPSEFKKFTPPSMVSSDLNLLIKFIKKQNCKVVLKPLFNAQSKGVLIITSKTSRPSLISKLKNLTSDFTVPILAQKYLSSITTKGELRLWYANGKCIASVIRRPLKNDFKVQTDRGSTTEAYSLSQKEKALSIQIGAYLRKNKIQLAAIDLIDLKITDFNFTSPGLIVQMEEVLKKNLSKDILKLVLKKIF